MCWACTITINSTSPLHKQCDIPLQQFTCHNTILICREHSCKWNEISDRELKQNADV